MFLYLGLLTDIFTIELIKISRYKLQSNPNNYLTYTTLILPAKFYKFYPRTLTISIVMGLQVLCSRFNPA